MKCAVKAKVGLIFHRQCGFLMHGHSLESLQDDNRCYFRWRKKQKMLNIFKATF